MGSIRSPGSWRFTSQSANAELSGRSSRSVPLTRTSVVCGRDVWLQSKTNFVAPEHMPTLLAHCQCSAHFITRLSRTWQSCLGHKNKLVQKLKFSGSERHLAQIQQWETQRCHENRFKALCTLFNGTIHHGITNNASCLQYLYMAVCKCKPPCCTLLSVRTELNMSQLFANNEQ